MATYRGCPVSPAGELTEGFRELLGDYLDREDRLPEPRDWRSFAIYLLGCRRQQELDKFDQLSKRDAVGPRSPTHEVLERYSQKYRYFDVAFLWDVLHNKMGREDVALELVSWHHRGTLLRDPDELPYYVQITSSRNGNRGDDPDSHNLGGAHQQGGQSTPRPIHPGPSGTGGRLPGEGDSLVGEASGWSDGSVRRKDSRASSCREGSQASPGYHSWHNGPASNHSLESGPRWSWGDNHGGASPDTAGLRGRGAGRCPDRVSEGYISYPGPLRGSWRDVQGPSPSDLSSGGATAPQPPVEESCPLGGAPGPSSREGRSRCIQDSSGYPSAERELAPGNLRPILPGPQFTGEYDGEREWGPFSGRDPRSSSGPPSSGATTSSGVGSEGAPSFPGPLVDFSPITASLPLQRAGAESSVAATVPPCNTSTRTASTIRPADSQTTQGHRVGISFHRMDLALAERLKRNLKKNGCHVTLLRGLSVLRTQQMDAVVVVYTHHYKETLLKQTRLLSSIRFVFHNLQSEYKEQNESNQRGVFYPNFDVKGHRIPRMFCSPPERLTAREVFDSLYARKVNGN